MNNLRNDSREWLLASSGALLAVSVISFWLFGSYFGVNVPGSLITPGDDGWCKVPEESIGHHCFGDLHERVFPSPTDFIFPPYPNNMETSPIGPYVTLIAGFVYQLFGPQAMLGIFWLAYLVLLLSPVVLATRHARATMRVMSISIIGLASFPTLATLDRMNLVAFVPLLLFLFVRSLEKKNYRISIISLTLLVSVKVIFIPLLLVFLGVREFKTFFRATVAASASVFFLVIAPAGFSISRWWEWLQVALGFAGGEIIALGSRNPPSLSWSASFHSWAEIAGRPLGNEHQIALILTFSCISGLLIVVATLIGPRIGSTNLAFVIAVTTVLGVGAYVAVYYSTVFLALAAWILYKQGPDSSIRAQGEIGLSRQQKSGLLGKILVGLTSISIAPLYFPLIHQTPIKFGPDVTESGMPLLTSTLWLVAILVFLFKELWAFLREYFTIQQAPKVGNWGEN